MRDKPTALERERAISELAARQHGVVTSGQLAELGFSRSAIARRAESGRLHRLHRGVYAVGHPVVSAQSTRLAAVLACGNGALASHATAGAIWGLRPDGGRVRHVLTTGTGRSRPGIRVHHAADLDDADRGHHAGIPVTSLARTLIDLGDVVAASQVRSAFVRAEQARILDVRALEAALTRATRRRGPTLIRELLRGYDPRWQATRSELELMMLDLLSAHHLPAPEVNAWLANHYMVDFLWRRERLVVETDGAAFHAGERAQRSDARRDHGLSRLGFRVARFGYREVVGDPARVALTIRAYLGTREGAELSEPLASRDHHARATGLTP